MMNEKKADKIMADVLKVWEERHGKENIDPTKVGAVREMLLLSPHEDGVMPVTTFGIKGTRAVPMKDIILNGLYGGDVEKYPVIDEPEGDA